MSNNIYSAWNHRFGGGDSVREISDGEKVSSSVREVLCDRASMLALFTGARIEMDSDFI